MVCDNFLKDWEVTLPYAPIWALLFYKYYNNTFY